MTIWTAFGSCVAVFALLAFLKTALTAQAQLEEARRSARVSLTAQVLQADWLNTVVNAWNDVLRRNGRRLAQVKQYRLQQTQAAASNSLAVDWDVALGERFIGCYVFVALLYASDNADRALLISYANIVAGWAFVFGDTITNLVDCGFYPAQVLDYARDSIKSVKTNQKLLQLMPELNHFTI